VLRSPCESVSAVAHALDRMTSTQARDLFTGQIIRQLVPEDTFDDCVQLWCEKSLPTRSRTEVNIDTQYDLFSLCVQEIPRTQPIAVVDALPPDIYRGRRNMGRSLNGAWVATLARGVA
jgi:hypothetical protein